jgi:hypothetical protein
MSLGSSPEPDGFECGKVKSPYLAVVGLEENLTAKRLIFLAAILDASPPSLANAPRCGKWRIHGKGGVSASRTSAHLEDDISSSAKPAKTTAQYMSSSFFFRLLRR